MKLQTVPAQRGVTWTREGFRVFLTQPLAFASLFATSLFGLFALALVPVLGAALAMAALPLATLGFMVGTREVVQGRRVTPMVYLEPLRAPRAQVVAIVQLGLLYAAGTVAIIWLSDWLDGGAVEALMTALPDPQNTPEKLAEHLAKPELALGLTLRLGLAGLMSVPFWHAPALVHWDGHGCAKALFSSTVACWRNKGAFTIYSLVWFGIILGLGLAGSLLFGLLGTPQMFTGLAVPLSLLLTTVFYASLYFTFADCFVNDEPSAPLGRTTQRG